MSAKGLTQTLLATQLAEALRKDGPAATELLSTGGTKFGPAVSAWLREVAEHITTLSQAAGDTPVPEPTPLDAKDAIRKRLAHYSPDYRKRVSSLASRLVIGRVSSGDIPCTDEAIQAATPQAVEDALQAMNAVDEFLCG